MTSTDLPAFDPAAITPELVDGLDKAQLRAVLAHHQVPDQPKAATKGHLQTLARMALAAHAIPPALEAGPSGEPDRDAAAELETLVEAASSHVVPQASRWQLILQMAAVTAKSNLCPKDLKGKPNDVALIYLKANDIGVPLTAALEQLYVVHGKVGMESKMMRALVRRDGHSITTVESDRFHARVHGWRSDEPHDEDDGYFDLNDAVDQGLIQNWRMEGEGDDARIVVTPVQGKDQWKKDPKLMCVERATARLCRQLFSDCLAGVSYTPDELGFIDVDPADDDRPAGAPEQTISIDKQRSEIAQRIAELPDDLKAELREAWKRRNLPGPADLKPSAIRTAMNLLEPVEAKAFERRASAEANIDDAELVEDDDAEQTSETEQASPAPPAETDDLAREVCAGCHEPIGDDQATVYDDAEQPWHAECAPFVR